ncbi:MAG: XdhC family protein [Actinobacteria bacterium]|nr:XdhC family protein [Actinomycetota bacterium]
MNSADVGRAVAEWHAGGRTCAFARIREIRGVGSAAVGEVIAWNEAGDAVGELLGGAVDEPVEQAARRLLAAPDSVEVLDLTIDDTGAVQAGLSCGGGVTIVVQGAGLIPGDLWSALAERRPVVLATVVSEPPGSLVVLDGEESFGSVGEPEADSAVEDAARRLLAGGETASTRVEVGDRTVLIDAFVPDPSLVLVGDGALADAIARQAAVLGWQATVTTDVDAATKALDAAGASAALVMLSHAVKLDVPVLAAALRSDVPYVGALGSARTQQRRSDRLRADGITDAEIDRIHGPIGLDLGGNRPANIALGICAEILASRNRRDAVSLEELVTLSLDSGSAPLHGRTEWGRHVRDCLPHFCASIQAEAGRAPTGGGARRPTSATRRHIHAAA